jgi:hypothetical protein
MAWGRVAGKAGKAEKERVEGGWEGAEGEEEAGTELALASLQRLALHPRSTAALAAPLHALH